MKKFLLSALAAAALMASANAASYEVDPSSKIGFSVKHLKLMSVEGSFDKFSGMIDYDAGKITALTGAVEVASVDTQNQKRDDHLKAADIFDQAKFPQMTFKMTEFKDGKMTGDLSIKGTTKSVTFDTTTKMDGNKLLVDATGQVKRSDFGTVWESNLKDSMAGDEVTIKLNLVANPK